MSPPHDDKKGAEEQEESSTFMTCLKWVCCPVILFFMSIRIYFCGCLGNKCVDCGHTCQKVLCCGQFKDSEWGGDSKAIGEDQGEVEWLPFEDVVADMYYNELKKAGKKVEKSEVKAVLIEGKIEPADMNQGSSGNCWWIAALSAIAEHPGALFQSMRTTSYNPYGKYHFQFFNANEGVMQWEEVVIDNLIPCKRRGDSLRTIYAEPNNNEAWVLLIEKAMAKWCGAYGKLDGGSSAWALTALTGNTTYVYSRNDENKFKRWGSAWEATKSDKRASCLKRNSKYGTPDPYTPDELWEIILDNDKRRSIMGCSVTEGNSDREKTSNGLVCRHAYTLIRACSVESKKFVRVRNPWGNSENGEWTGRFSDNDKKSWDANPKIKKELIGDDTKLDSKDGAFWMLYEDFWSNFGSVTICPRKTGVVDLIIPVDESDMCPQAQGCCRGCCHFWCCCEGTRALCCSSKAKI